MTGGPMWQWLEALSVILCILIHAPRKSHEQILGEHEQMLLNLDVVLAAGCFVTISSPPPIYNLDASCFLLTHPRFIPPLVLNWRLEWTKQQQLHVTSKISEQFLVYHSSIGVWM